MGRDRSARISLLVSGSSSTLAPPNTGQARFLHGNDSAHLGTVVAGPGDAPGIVPFAVSSQIARLPNPRLAGFRSVAMRQRR
jgi:hypothetical protein